MNTFLKLTAEDLWQRMSGDMSAVTVVFPNKRAALFFNDHIARQSDGPTWTPSYTTISELFRSQTRLKTGDPIKLVCDLYKIYKSVTGSNETLDSFYFWGEILISDFDDADKNLVDTSLMFRNLKDLGELSAGYDFLNPEQQEAIREFFHGYNSGGETELKGKFTAIWNSLGEIYERFKALLIEQGIAYEGMIYRQVIENLDVDRLPSKTYAFVGFNVLNKVEQRLFSLLDKAGKALFYWDYDTFYLYRTPHEAGEFMRRNLRNFPSCLPESCFDNLSAPKDINFIQSSTDTGQARHVTDWIARNLTKDDERQTAVVLCNEQLLLPVLHSIPDIVEDINITMGYPLSQTSPCSHAIDILDKYVGDDNRQVCQDICQAIKSQAVTGRADTRSAPTVYENIDGVRAQASGEEFRAQASSAPTVEVNAGGDKPTEHADGRLQGYITFDSQLDTEAYFRTYTVFTRLSTLIESGDLIVETHTLRRLSKRILSATTIPFHGEPAKGLQVMGVLETRNLDFKNILMLSVNEGKIPKGENSVSFIPFNLRKAFGMTTVDHKVAVYAYYFYRLIQRCEHATMVYTTVTEGANRSEMSRFMLQLVTELPYKIRDKREEIRIFRATTRVAPTGFIGLGDGSGRMGTSPIPTVDVNAGGDKQTAPTGSVIRKTGEMIERLRSRYDIKINPKALMSPTALNTYLTCRMKFFFRYVAGLKLPDKTDDEIDPARFGTIFHKAAEKAYNDLTSSGNLITKEVLRDKIKDTATLKRYATEAFLETYPIMNGSHLVASEVIFSYFKRLLRIDERYAPFYYIGSERCYTHDLSCPEIHTRIGGIVDRVDRKDGTVRIVDYKTGSKAETVRDIQSLFDRSGAHDGYSFQTFLYSSILCDVYPQNKIAPALLFIHKAAADDYSPLIKMGPPRGKKIEITDFNELKEEFRENLQGLVREIFDPEVPFEKTEVEDNCKYCDFKELCGSLH